MLEVDADKRITAAQTLSHPYLEEVSKVVKLLLDNNLVPSLFKQYADPTDEPIAPFYDQTFEDYELSVEVWKGENY